METKINYFEATNNILIVGSGLAGMKAALEVQKEGIKPIVFTKGKAGRDGATVQAEADIALDSYSCNELFKFDGDVDDSPNKFYEDIVKAGMYLNNQELVEKHVKKAPIYLKELKNLGLKINDLVKTPGHIYPRGLWTTGEEIIRVLRKEINKLSITMKNNHVMLDIIVVENEVQGILVLDMNEGEVCFYSSKSAILATGGASSLYLQNTNPPGMTGDGMAAAYRAGVGLQDMEFPMFLPFTVIKPEILKGMAFPHDLVVNLNVHLLNKKGERYINKWDPKRKEKTTRDINSIAAELEIKNGNGSPNDGVYMSFKHLPDNLIEYSSKWLPESINNWTYGKINYKNVIPDLTKNALEVKPACHFWNGGIVVNNNTSTVINGLYACGEGTGGFHGSNRISGNALTHALIWGSEAGKNASQDFKKTKNKIFPKEKIEQEITNLKGKIFAPIINKKGYSPLEIRKELQLIAKSYLRPIRIEKDLKVAIKKCERYENIIKDQSTINKNVVYNKEWQIALENYNLLTILKMILKSSKLRKESRGAHYRIDYPKTDNAKWLYNIILKKDSDGDMISIKQKPILKDFKPNNESFFYGGLKDER